MRLFRWFLNLALISVAMLPAAHAESVEFSVTPTDLDQSNYRFAVSTDTTHDEVTFHVTVTSKKEDIQASSQVSLAIVINTKTPGGGEEHSIGGVKPEIPIELKKDKRIWQAQFKLPHELLAKPGLCFVFTEFAHTIINGKSVAMPAADFYEVKLQDFLKQ